MVKIGRKIAVETGFPPAVHHRSPNQADSRTRPAPHVKPLIFFILIFFNQYLRNKIKTFFKFQHFSAGLYDMIYKGVTLVHMVRLGSTVLNRSSR
jgi:hypothetical protein